MAASSDGKGGEMPERRHRYRRSDGAGLISLTPIKRELLRYLAECRILSLPQLASFVQLSEKGARRQMRQLFDAGLVDVVPVSRAALAPDGALNDETLLHGSAPNLYVPTVAALKVLVEAGTLGRHYLKRAIPAYGPKNGLFLRHELLVRDVRVWLELLARGGHGRTIRWEDGADAALDLQEEKLAKVVRPDAWFAFEITMSERPATLVGLVEVDRGTERGKSRWSEKLLSYHALFASQRLPELTGYVNARVLVLCPDAARRDLLVSLIEELAGSNGLASRFWLAAMATLSEASLADSVWRVPGRTGLVPLLNI